MKETLAAYCARIGNTLLLTQWDYMRNLPLSPDALSHGSHKKVWWVCDKKHHWRATVHNRTSNHSGCPICAGKIPLPGETDLAAQFPRIAAEWHPTKNGSLTPRQVMPGSHRKVWWKCSQGHEWQAEIRARISGSGCPLCTGKTSLRSEQKTTKTED